MSLLKVKTPGNASGFNGFLNEIAGFEFFSTEFITTILFYFPEDEPYNFSFLQAGFETVFLIPGIGTLFYIMLINVVLIICHSILHFVQKICPKVK